MKPACGRSPVSNEELIDQVQQGEATLDDLTDGGATQRGVASDDYGAGCPDTGNGCTDFFAVSIPGVTPSSFITWFQAAAVCRNSGKRLLTNQEWQVAALGTPDPGAGGDGVNTCNTTTGGPVATGSTGDCESDVGAFDMVGNVREWVADWVQDFRNRSGATGPTTPTFGSDRIAGINPATPVADRFPGALIRGGRFSFDTGAGVFALAAGNGPSNASSGLGFRCGR